MLKGCLHHPIRAEVIGIRDREELGQVHSAPMHPALHGSNRDTTDLGGFLIRQALRPNQDQRLPVLNRELGERPPQVQEVTPRTLIRGCPKVSRIGALRVLQFVLALRHSL